jgi:hypothetical protein
MSAVQVAGVFNSGPLFVALFSNGSTGTTVIRSAGYSEFTEPDPVLVSLFLYRSEAFRLIEVRS